MDLLPEIWGNQTGFVFLPYKDSRWHEVPGLEWPTENGKVDSQINLNADQYFCPVVFSEPRRRKENAQPTSWLWADLDTVDPRHIDLRPTVAVQSSPGRYQAFWRLKRRIDPSRQSPLNRRLTYTIGADKGGWDLTQVLRVPGTYNFKPEYGTRQRVRLLWGDGPTYKVSEIEEYVKGVEAHVIDTDAVEVPLPAESRESILKRIWPRLDRRVRVLLSESAEQPIGQRSDRLWELECRLFEAGLDSGEVFLVVRNTVWNKFTERSDGDYQLWTEVKKAHLYVGRSLEVSPDRSTSPDFPGSNDVDTPLRVRPRIITYSDLLGSALTEPEWLVEDWWTLGSHGIVAGLPKSYKSLITLDLAVSCAAEVPFLGLHEVNPKGCGPVLVVQQENSLPLLRDRLWKITRSRGLHKGMVEIEQDSSFVVVEFPPAIPLMFYNDFTFDMTFPEDREAIEEIIQREGVKMVIFDPLYLMIGAADENSARDMRPILQWLLLLRNRYRCAIVVVHHWGKTPRARGGRGLGGIKLLGSTVIYGWLEAALYLEASRTEEMGYQIVVEKEFRERTSPPPVAFNLAMGDIGDSQYAWVKEGAISDLMRILQLIERVGQKGATLRFLMSETGLGNKSIRKGVEELLAKNQIWEKRAGKERRFYASEDEASDS